MTTKERVLGKLLRRGNRLDLIISLRLCPIIFNLFIELSYIYLYSCIISIWLLIYVVIRPQVYYQTA